MTNSEIYNSVYDYRNLRAKSGCAKDKKYWISELRILRHLVDHNIIMNRGSNGQGNDIPELQAAYDNLRTGYETAMKFVHGESK
jgi:hypothetical protein